MKKNTFSRRNMYQIIAIILVAFLALIMFLIGKQHIILLDNKTVEVDGKTYSAFSIVEVKVDKRPFLELAARDRDKEEVMGQKHKITVRYMDKSYEEHTIVKKFKVPLGHDMVLISVPALAGGADQAVWLEHYIAPTAVVAPIADPIESEDDFGLDMVTF